jgi:hypothetical protein
VKEKVLIEGEGPMEGKEGRSNGAGRRKCTWREEGSWVEVT